MYFYNCILVAVYHIHYFLALFALLTCAPRWGKNAWRRPSFQWLLITDHRISTIHKSKVSQKSLIIGIEKDILWFNIAMKDCCVDVHKPEPLQPVMQW